MPSRLSWYARRLAPMRVEVKTSTWRKSRDCTRYTSSSRLRSRRTGCATCCTNSAAVLSRATCTSTGSCRNESASVRMSWDRVAENNRFWRCLGRSAMIRRPAGRGEAPGGHTIGFVEHKSFDLLQVHRLLLNVVEQPARGRHQKLDSLAQ